MSIMTASLLLWACGNNTPKRIVSEVPIKTEVLGLKLGDVSSEDAVETALTKATGKYVLTESQKNGIATVVRAIPTSLEISYGGLSWHYVDVTLDKEKKIALLSDLSSKVNDSKIVVLDSFNLDEIKTKKFAEVMNNIKVSNALFVIEGENKNVVLSGRNIPTVKVSATNEINTYDVLKYDTLVVTKAAVEKLEEVYA